MNALATGAGAPDGGVGRDPPDQERLGQLAEEQAARVEKASELIELTRTNLRELEVE